MAIKTTRYGTSNEIPPLTTPLEKGKTVTFPYKASDSQSQMSSEGGVHLMIVEGGRLIFTDDSNTFLPTFNASDITITWKHPFHRVDYKDEVVFIFNAFAKESEGMVHFRYVATGGQTTFSGADADGNTLAYSVADAVQVFKNGAYVPQTDYTATSLTSIVLNSGASASDTITIWALQNLVDQTDLVSAINSSSASATAAATSATNASNDADDAEKWANHNFNTLFTLSDGVTTGYSAKSRSTDAQRFAEHPVNTTFGITGENTSTHYSAKHYANEASNSATSASNSATSATNDAAAAAVSATAAQNSLDSFEAVYLGASATDPTTDANGDALTAGDQYFNTTNDTLYVYNGSSWQTAGTPYSLSGLSDVDNSMSPTSGQVLQYDGSDWDAATLNISTTLAALTDTNLSSIQDDQVLQYDNASSQWKNETLNLTTTLASLTDTTISSPQDDQILRYDNSDSKWKNETAGYLTSISGQSIEALSDVGSMTPSTNDVLYWTGSAWSNSANPGGFLTSIGGSSITDLSDVKSSMSPSTDDVLFYNGSEWTSGSGYITSSDSIENLNDVAVMTPSTGDYLYWNGSAWTNSSIVLTTGDNIDDLSNVQNAMSPSTGDHLYWDGSKWNKNSNTLTTSSPLNALSDVSASTPATNHVLQWDGSAWVAANAGASTLSALTDTTISSPSGDQVLSYDSANNDWRNVSFATANLSDVAISSIQDDQILRYNNANSRFENESLSLRLDEITQGTASSDLSTSSGYIKAKAFTYVELEAPEDIYLDHGSSYYVRFQEGGAEYLTVRLDTDVQLKAVQQNSDIKFIGMDDSTEITALTLDMSEEGKALFNHYVVADGNGTSGGVTLQDGKVEIRTGTGSVASVDFYCESSNAHKVTVKAPPHANFSGDVNFQLPSSEGSNGQVLQTDGSGNTSWAAASGGASALNDLSDVKYQGTDFTGSLKIGSATTGTLASANYNVLIGNDVADGMTDAAYNTAVGYQALEDLVGADNNTAVGYQAGRNITSGFSNVIVGAYAGNAISTSWSNTMVGQGAGRYTNGLNNVFVGMQAGKGGINPYVSNGNVGIGYDALSEVEGSANYNVAIGMGAGDEVTTGDGNILIGFQSGDLLTTGAKNTIIGYNMDPDAADSDGQVVIGTDVKRIHIDSSGGVQFNSAYRFPTSDGSANQVLQTDGSGALSFATVSGSGGGASDLDGLSDVKKGGTDFTNSMMIGATSTGTLSSASDNLFIGTSGSGDALTSGTYNIGVGNFSLSSVSSGTTNIGVGYSAGHSNNSNHGIFIGHQAGQYLTGSASTIIGYEAAKGTSGNTTASYTTAIGFEAAYSLTTAAFTVHIGHRAGKMVSSGGYSVNIGAFAGNDTSTGDSNTNIGYEAGRHGNNIGNVYIGRLAGHGVSAVTGANYNVGVGYNSLTAITSGEGNICIGKDAGDSITSADNNTIIGTGMDPDSATAGGEVVIGTNTRRIHIDNSGGVQFNSAFRFPTADGSANQVLQTDGSGAVSWATVSGGGGGGVVTAINNGVANRLTTIGSTTTELDAEANLTFSNSILTLTSEDGTANAGPFFQLDRQSPSVAAGDEIGQIRFKGHNSFNGNVTYGQIGVRVDDPSATTEQTTMHVSVRYNNGTVNLLNLNHQYVSIANEQSFRWTDVTASNYTITWANATPTASRTITFPDATGTVLTTGNSDTPTTTTSSGDADFVLVDDGGTMKKITPANLGIGGGGGGASDLDGLSDVTISSPSNGQVLKYDGSGWVNGTDADSGGGGGGITTGKAIAMAMVFG